MAVSRLVDDITDLTETIIDLAKPDKPVDQPADGVDSMILMKITYYIDPEKARKIQSRTVTSYGMTDEEWFSNEDFDDLLKAVQQINGNCHVSLHAQQSTTCTYFKYSSKFTEPLLPVVEVELYKDGNSFNSEQVITIMNNRWGSQFKIIAGPLPPAKSQPTQ